LGVVSDSDSVLAERLAAVFARMSGLFLSTDAVTTALNLITSLAVQTLPKTVGAGISLVDQDGKRLTAAATDQVVRRADALQYELGQGPCLTALADRVLVRMDDLAQDDRWSGWARPAAELGLRSAMSAPLVAGAEALGALKVYARVPDAYTDREEHVLMMFATQAAMLLANMHTAQDAERVSDELKDSLRGREVITLAKGIVMAREGVDERMAFLTLFDTARREQITLRKAAERLARTTVRRLR
jgi:GAF domain-containing protein